MSSDWSGRFHVTSLYSATTTAPAIADRNIADRAPLFRLNLTGRAAPENGVTEAELEELVVALVAVLVLATVLPKGVVLLCGVVEREIPLEVLVEETWLVDEGVVVEDADVDDSPPMLKVGLVANICVTLLMPVAIKVYPSRGGTAGSCRSREPDAGCTLLAMPKLSWKTVLTRKIENVDGSPASFVHLMIV